MGTVLRDIGRWIVRTALAAVGFLIVALAGYIAHACMLFFSHTSYRFVSLFLLIILVSNILAKIGLVYAEV